MVARTWERERHRIAQPFGPGDDEDEGAEDEDDDPYTEPDEGIQQWLRDKERWLRERPGLDGLDENQTFFET